LIGRLTFAPVYFLSATLCVGAAWSERRGATRIGPASFHSVGSICWWIVASVLFVLGLNRLLDLPNVLTDGVRSLAQAHQWYELRRSYQLGMIVAIALAGVIGSLSFIWLFRRASARYHVAVVGLWFLLAFVAIRSTSFHNVDAIIGIRFLGLKLNWIFEMVGIGLIDVAAASALVSSRSPDPPDGPDDHRGPRTYRIPGY
jgi:hypothetical protein